MKLEEREKVEEEKGEEVKNQGRLLDHCCCWTSAKRQEKRWQQLHSSQVFMFEAKSIRNHKSLSRIWVLSKATVGHHVRIMLL